MGEEQAAPPWYQSTLFWGCVGAFLAIVLTVLAAMMHDVRWVLAFAWPFAAFAAWEFARTYFSRKIVIWTTTGIVALVSGFFLAGSTWP
jgi:hypothetical protein